MLRAGIIAAIITYVLAVGQTALGSRVALWGVSPDLLLVWCVCAGLIAGPQAGAVVGFASGVFQGSLAQAFLGPFGVGKTLSGALAGLLAGKLSRENWLTPIVCVVVLTIVNELTVLLLAREVAAAQFARLLGVRALYHAVLAWPCYAALHRLWRAQVRPRALVG